MIVLKIQFLELSERILPLLFLPFVASLLRSQGEIDCGQLVERCHNYFKDGEHPKNIERVFNQLALTHVDFVKMIPRVKRYEM